MEENRKSILQMARGAIQERTDYEMARMMENILDANTNPTAKRKMTLTLELTPDADRRNIGVKCVVKCALAPTNAVVTSLYVADENNVVEMVPQIPGQYDMNGGEQEPPQALRIIKFA